VICPMFPDHERLVKMHKAVLNIRFPSLWQRGRILSSNIQFDKKVKPVLHEQTYCLMTVSMFLTKVA